MALDKIFDFDDSGEPQENILVYERLSYLEKLCYQLRAK